MAMEGLATDLADVHLDPKSLPFNVPSTFEAPPRYLFRVTTRKSAGKTDNVWVKSKDSAAGLTTGDCFARADIDQVALELNQHLRGWDNDHDNFVSWTSSLLFALLYIYHKTISEKDDRSSLYDIELCIIDTSEFDEENLFVRDVDMIRHFSPFDSTTSGSGLSDLMQLRQSKHPLFNGSFYFREYLSQGSLKVEGKVQVVLAKAIVNAGLHHLRPDIYQPTREWPVEVVSLRNFFYSGSGEPIPLDLGACMAAIAIARLFGGRWKLPIAASFMALLPRKESKDDASIAMVLENLQISDDEKQECAPAKTKVIASDTMPEVKEFQKILNLVYLDYQITKVSDSLRHVVDAIQDCTELFPALQDLSAHESPLLDRKVQEVRVQLHDISSATAAMAGVLDRVAKA